VDAVESESVLLTRCRSGGDCGDGGGDDFELKICYRSATLDRVFAWSL